MLWSGNDTNSEFSPSFTGMTSKATGHDTHGSVLTPDVLGMRDRQVQLRFAPTYDVGWPPTMLRGR